MKHLIIILILFALHSSCRKEETKLKKEDADFKIQYTLNSNNKVFSISKLDNGVIDYKIEYNYYSDSITEIKYNSDNTIIYTLTYYINNKGLADSSIYYNHSTNSIESKRKYEYNSNNQLVKSTPIMSADDTIFSENLYSYTGGNLTSIELNADMGYGSFSCTDRLVYNDKSSDLDTHEYFSKIKGLSSINLIELITYQMGCPYGPSYRYATSEYIYIINDDGYITKRKEIYTPGGSSSDSDPVCENEIIEYEYIFL